MVAREARLPGERDAQEVFRAVSELLGLHLGRDQARHIAAHLPLGLRQIWERETRDAGAPRHADRGALIRSLQSRLGLERAEEAETLLTLVCAWLKHLAPEERDDVAASLSPGLRELWTDARLPVVPSWRRLVSRPHPLYEPREETSNRPCQIPRIS
jgi:uncharacterized protein (DUF2267 family)